MSISNGRMALEPTIEFAHKLALKTVGNVNIWLSR
jgi:hypothetical protein